MHIFCLTDTSGFGLEKNNQYDEIFKANMCLLVFVPNFDAFPGKKVTLFWIK